VALSQSTARAHGATLEKGLVHMAGDFAALTPRVAV
jgi:hypothetical protein